MDTENKQTEQRKTIVPILATIGTGSVLAAVVSILGAKWPWLLLIFGIMLIIIAIFLSIPSTVNFFSPIRISKRIYKTYIWLRYKPKIIISDPVIERIEIASDWVNAPPEPQYKARFTISVNNKAMPIKLRVHESIVFIEQETEWEINTIYLGNIPGQPEIEAKPFAIGHLDIDVVTSSRGVIHNPPDLQKEYRWGIQRIYITLPEAGTRELHRGIYHKPK